MSVVIGLVVIQSEDDFLVHLVGHVEYLGGICHKSVRGISQCIFQNFLCLRIIAESKINLGKQCLSSDFSHSGSFSRPLGREEIYGLSEIFSKSVVHILITASCDSLGICR